MASSALGFTLGDSTNGVLNTYTVAPTILINGTDRTSKVLSGESQVTMTLGQPKSCALTVNGKTFTPATGHSVVILDDGPSGTVKWFAGTLTEVSATIDNAVETVRYQCIAQDYRWLIDRYATVTGIWEGCGINTIVRDVVAGFTDGGFAVGYAPDALGTLARFEATNERVWDVLTRLAQAAGAYLDVDADKRVHLFKTPDHLSAGTVALTNTSKNVVSLTAAADITDIATRMRVIAGGTVTRATVAPGARSIPVVAVDMFPATGTALVGAEYVTVEGTTTVVGSEAIAIASPGLVRGYPAGTAVRPVGVADDATAQTALATKLGGGLSGIAVRALDDDSLSASEAAALASNTLALISSGVASVAGTMIDAWHTDARNCWPGASIVATVSSPITVSGTFRIQSVTLCPITIAGGVKTWTRSFHAAPVARGFEVLDTLAQSPTSRFRYA
jgi:hypothetical protein